MEELIKGLADLKNGALVNLIAIILVIIVVGSILGTIGMTKPMTKPNAIMILAALGSMVLVLLVAMILGIIGFIYYFKATGHLKRYNSNLGIGRTGITLQLIGCALVFLSVLIVAAMLAAHMGAVAIVTLPIMLILGVVLMIIGAIFFGIMLMRLGEDPNVESGFKTAGIIYLIGMVLAFILGIIGDILGIIVTIMIYVSAKRSLSKLMYT